MLITLWSLKYYACMYHNSCCHQPPSHYYLKYRLNSLAILPTNCTQFQHQFCVCVLHSVVKSNNISCNSQIYLEIVCTAAFFPVLGTVFAGLQIHCPLVIVFNDWPFQLVSIAIIAMVSPFRLIKNKGKRFQNRIHYTKWEPT